MKKVISILLVCLMMGLTVGCAAAESDTNAGFFYPTRTGVRVEAMFAAPDIQPYTGEDGDQSFFSVKACINWLTAAASAMR